MVAYRLGYPIRRGITIDRLVINCWQRHPEPSAPQCVTGDCDRNPGHGACQSTLEDLCPEITGLHSSQIPSHDDVFSKATYDEQLECAVDIGEIAFSGGLAVQKLTDEYDLDGTHQDRGDFEVLLLKMYGHESYKRQLVWDHCCEGATNLLNQGLTWAMIVAIAEALLADPKRTLSGERFCEIISGVEDAT